jgi:hypothetical protein
VLLVQSDIVGFGLCLVIAYTVVDEDALQVADLNAPALGVEVCSGILEDVHVCGCSVRSSRATWNYRRRLDDVSGLSEQHQSTVHTLDAYLGACS